MSLIQLTLPVLDAPALATVAGIALALCGLIILLPLYGEAAPAKTCAPAQSTVKMTAAPAVSPQRTRSTPLSAEDQWRKVSGVIASAGDSAASIRKLQRSAGSHLDSANYLLQELMFELEAVMPSTAKVHAGLRDVTPARPRYEPRPIALAA